MSTYDNVASAKCPKWGSPARAEKIFEICRKNPKRKQALQDIMANCVTPEALRHFHDMGVGADPCEHCENNEIIIVPGTFIRCEQVDIEQLCMTQWAEVHRCLLCNTAYTTPTPSTSLP